MTTAEFLIGGVSLLSILFSVITFLSKTGVTRELGRVDRLSNKIDAIQTDITTIKVDMAVVKTTLNIQEEK